jgi:hypothetical protein
MKKVNEWVALKTEFDEAIVFCNPSTGELWFSGETYSFELDCETLRALYRETERVGMYD